MIGNKTIVGLVITTMVLSCVAVAVSADEGRVDPMGILPGSITGSLIATDTIPGGDLETDIIISTTGSIATTSSGTITSDGTLTVGSDGSGSDVIFYSDIGSNLFLWNATSQSLNITGDTGQTALNITDGNLVVAGDASFGGALSFGGDLDMAGNIITNIGDIGTDFDTDGGLTLANALTVTSGGATITAGGLTVTAGNVVAGIDGTADDVTFYSSAVHEYLKWGNTEGLTVGTDDHGVDVTFYADATGDSLVWNPVTPVLTITGATDTTALNIADGKLLVADGATITAGGLTVSAGGATIHGTVTLDDDQIQNAELAANAVPTLMNNSAARVSTSSTTYDTTNWVDNTWAAGTLDIPRTDAGSNLSIHYTAETDVSHMDTVLHVTCRVGDADATTQDIKFGDYASINQTFSAVFYKTGVTADSPIKIGYRSSDGHAVGLTNQTIVVVAYPA